MILVIRSEQPLRLGRMLVPLQRLAPSAGEIPQRGEPFLTKVLTKAEAYRELVDPQQWEEETAALRQLMLIDGEQTIEWKIQQVVLPADLPVSCLPLAAGWVVRECAGFSKQAFSPLAFIWLAERGVQQIGELTGRIDRVELGEGIALLQVAQNEVIPVVRERREHAVEHVDEGMMLLQANVDDSSPEWLGYVMEQLLRAGANDVCFFPITMKKSRPGVMLQVLCYQSQVEALKSILFQETTTFGLRYFPVACHRLARRFVTVSTSWGEVAVKLGYHRGRRVHVAPEYSACARLAEAAGVPLKQVYQQALQRAEEIAPLTLEK
jgi:hypothetical protein